MAASQEVTATNFEELLSSDKPLIVDFWATWSVPCLMQKPNLEDAADELKELAIWGSIDIDTEHTLTERFSVISIPTVLIFYQGAIVKQFIGIQDTEVYVEYIKKLLGIEENAPTERIPE